ncbi:MAG: hypothetical protein E6I76_02015 [Chloroflexi bacterium]|nr:MAG: hypothetical protein E6I76_02015 [Chloroflexota bacterium]
MGGAHHRGPRRGGGAPRGGGALGVCRHCDRARDRPPRGLRRGLGDRWPQRVRAPGRRWQVRAVDLDVLGHVNNAVHWAAVEDELARLLPHAVSVEAECEYRVAMEPDDDVQLRSIVEGSVLRTWITGDRGPCASSVVRAQASSR